MDYLCVIREKNNKTYFETIDIPASTELVSTLETCSPALIMLIQRRKIGSI